MRLADIVVKHLYEVYGVEVVFTITGGGAMYLNDAFGSYEKIKYISLHHEQSISMATESYARISGKLGVCQVTTGPGGTNAISGCAGAWIDSCPILFISGQVESYSIKNISSRQTGVQEVDIINIVKTITKDAIRIDDPYLILYELDRLISLANDRRKGPVWLDIPLDIQNFQIEKPSELIRYKPQKINNRHNDLIKIKVNKTLNKLLSSKKPIILIGNGCRESIEDALIFAENYNIPIVVGWNAKDLVPDDNVNFLGTAGQFGKRLANIAINSADLLIGLGYRFSIPQIGYDPSVYAPKAEIISVDIDSAEITKYSGFIDIGIQTDCKFFLDIISNIAHMEKDNLKFNDWTNKLLEIKKYNFDSGVRNRDKVDSFDFTNKLSNILPNNSIIITDMGTSFTCTHQELKIKKGMRLMTSSGLAAMGFGLPGAIGAAFAMSQNTVTLITGDGGIMFNIQELQSIVSFKLRIKIIIYENDGYLTMKLMQKGRFNRFVSSDKKSGISFPDFEKIANSYGLISKSISYYEEINSGLEWLYSNLEESNVLIVHTDPMQELSPRVQTQSNSDGKLMPGTLDNMFPFLDNETKLAIHNILE